jgi:hypothetical protein
VAGSQRKVWALAPAAPALPQIAPPAYTAFFACTLQRYFAILFTGLFAGMPRNLFASKHAITRGIFNDRLYKDL